MLFIAALEGPLFRVKLKRCNVTLTYGLVFAISGKTSPCFLGAPPR